MAQKFYADRNAKVVARRVNDTRSRLEKLAQRQVRKPPHSSIRTSDKLNISKKPNTYRPYVKYFEKT